MTTASLSPVETKSLYPDAMSLREARSRYFAHNGFGEETYVEPFVRIPIGPVAIYLPNLPSRKRAVKVHDLNHLVSGYGTDWQGEFEESAFELGTGMGGYWFAWFINMGGLGAGLVRSRERTLRAFARGRRARGSIYRHIARWNDELLSQPVSTLRDVVAAADEDVEVTAADKRAAFALGAAGLFLHGGVPLLVALAVLASLVWGLTGQ